MHRNAAIIDASASEMIQFLSSFYFLSTRYTWNSGDLNVGEPELFELLHGCRRSCITWLNKNAEVNPYFNISKQIRKLLLLIFFLFFWRKSGRRDFVAVLEKIYEAAMGDTPPPAATATWCLVSGEDSAGRYAVTRNKAHVQRMLAEPERKSPQVADNGRFLVEIDLQTYELRCARARVQALESDIAMDSDVFEIAGAAARTMQW